MVVRISSGSSPTGAVYYNEQKVGKGEAERLAVRNYLGVRLPVHELGLPTIAAKLEQQAGLNERIKKPTFHASLSLAQTEKPSAQDMLAMADRYMTGLGYGQQPYVVYQHFDTDHAHLHIVSVRVNHVGKKISDQHERTRSNQLRQQIEKEFGLQVAERSALRPERKELIPVEYGKGNLKRDISAIVNGVLKDYTFSSFSQYNQFLNLYNVRASQVTIEGKKTGLVYSATDNKGNAQGATFKASSLPQQPTMETVNRRMNAGKKVKGDRVARLRSVAETQRMQSKDWDSFQQLLSQKGIEVVPHIGKDQNLFGISFVDVRQRAIYTGSELGKAFTTNSLKRQLGDTYMPPSKRTIATANQPVHKPTIKQIKAPEPGPLTIPLNQTDNVQEQTSLHNLELIRQLLAAIGRGGPEQENDYELRKMLKKSRLKPRIQ